MISTFETIRLFRKMKFNQCLADIIFMVDFVMPDKPVIMNKDGTVFAVFEINGIEYESLEPSEIDDIEKEIRVFAEIIKEDVTITNYFTRRKGDKLSLKCVDSAPPLVKYLQHKKEQFYNSLDEETFQTSILCCIKLNKPVIKKHNFDYFSAVDREYVLPKRRILENFEKISAIYNMAKTSLKNTGFRELNHAEIFRHLFFIINGEKEAPPYRPDLSLNSQLARSAYSFKKNHYRVEKSFRRIIALIDEPPFTDRMFFRQFFDFKGTIVIKNFFTTIDYNRVKNTLKSNYKISKSMLFKKVLSVEYLSDYEEHQLDVEKKRRRPFYHHLSILVSSGNKDDLNRKTDEIIAKVCKTGAYAGKEKGYLPPAAVSFFPGQEGFNKRKRFILSSNLSNLFIKSKLSPGDAEPLEYFIDRGSNFYGLNPFSREDAPHMVITGSTGKGKSYLLIKLLLSFLAIDSRIIAIDKSLEYFFELLREIDPENTTIMRLEKDKIDLKFNPFLLPENSGGAVPEEQMSLCEGLLSLIIGENMKPAKKYLLRRSLEQFFREYSEVQRHSERMIKPLDILITIIKDKFRDANVENAVKLWLEGDRGAILNSGIDNLEHRKYCLFDLKGIEAREDILRVVVYLIFNKIDKLITDEKLLAVPKIFAVDEAKSYYDREELSPFMDRYIRQGRKHNLCMILNFQSINDALKTDKDGNLIDWSKGLFENIQAFLLFGRQLKIDHALKALKLTAYQRELYESLDTVRREFLHVSKGGGTRVLTPVTGPKKLFR